MTAALSCSKLRESVTQALWITLGSIDTLQARERLRIARRLEA